MAWQNPKTDWTFTYDESGEYVGDKFNFKEYNRIAGNLEFLRDIAKKLYIPGPGFADINRLKRSSYGYASTVNKLEDALKNISDNVFKPPDFPSTKTWYGNNPGPTVDDLNRIEGATLILYKIFQRQSAILSKLAFELNGSEF